MSEKTTPSLTRRRVFAGASTVGALAAAAALVPLARRGEEAAPAAGTTTAKADGYQVTDHVLRYYQTTRV